MSETPEDEGSMILDALRDFLPREIDGRSAILEMRDEGSKHWRQMEWIGFYPEFLFERYLAVGLGAESGPRFGNMRFDIQREYVWDLKAHAAGDSSWAPLNDLEAIEKCIENHDGVGFIVLSGMCTFSEDGSFKAWHDELKGGPSKYSRRIARRGALPRRRKVAFYPDHLVAFRFESISEISRAYDEGWAKKFQTGMRNSNNKPRRSKLQVDIERIGQWSLVKEIHR